MPKFRVPLLNIVAGGATITSGDVELTSYRAADRPAGSYALAHFYFEIPIEIFKYYWKSITYKGYTGFEAYQKIYYDLTSGSGSSTSEIPKSSVDNAGYAMSGAGKYIYGQYSGAVIDASGATMSIAYHDENVEGMLSDSRRWVYMSLTPAATYRDNNKYLETYRYVIKGIENSYLEIDCEPIGYDVIPVFPVNISINPTKDNNFAYQIRPSEHMRDSFIVESSRLTIHQNGNDYAYDMSVGETFVTVPANVLSVGPATYDISVNNSYEIPNTSGIVKFWAVGSSEAPTITGVTQDAFPVISWNSNNQKAWQLIVRGENGIVFDSGMRAGNEQSYKLTNMLVNGAYYAEVRNLNVYGYYTDWGTYGFVMNTTAPGEPTNIIVSVTNDYGAAVNCEAPADAGTLYVVRRPSGTDKSIIIGEYFNGFVDYTIPINTTYEYTVRNYNVGYADGEWIDATVNASGIIIRDGRNIEEYINLWKVGNGEFNLISNNIREKSLLQCVGRTYPVKESSEWIESTRVVEVFVPYEVYEKLRDMATNSKVVYLQNRGEFLTCDMEISDQGEYITKGRITQILLTRIDEV